MVVSECWGKIGSTVSFNPNFTVSFIVCLAVLELAIWTPLASSSEMLLDAGVRGVHRHINFTVFVLNEQITVYNLHRQHW